MTNTPVKLSSAAFEEIHGIPPTLVATAPGRVNLIGEHTDYNDGFVLPAAIHFHTSIAAGPRTDRMIDIVALDEDSARVIFAIDDVAKLDEDAPWSNYIRGVVEALLADGFKLIGANLVISGNVPLGAGLSSSAALEMASIAALTQLSDEPISGVDAAKAGQAAENNFVGVRCGIMDQLISSQAKVEHALLIDCRDLTLKPVSIPSELALLVINSNTRRALVDGEYNARREQCEQAAAHCNVQALRDLDLSQLEHARDALDPVVYRRARHVITENARTVAMADALEQADVQSIGRLMAQSHQSMRDDFEITTKELDTLVDIVKRVVEADGGARMTGGGFGGCVVALVPLSAVDAVITNVTRDYPESTGLSPSIMRCKTSAGAFPFGL